MKLEINKKEHELYLGLDFVAELDKKYPQHFGDISFGYGVGTMVLNLSQYNPVAIANFILAATNTNTNQPEVNEVEKYLMSLNGNQIKELADSFLDALALNSLTMATISQMGIVGEVLAAKAKLDEEENQAQ